MKLALEILTAFAPGLAWLWYFYRKDRREPEPARLVGRVFLLGCAAALAVLAVRPLLEPALPPAPGWARGIADAFLVTAATEEILKALAFSLGVLWHRQLDEPLDGIVYGAAAGLGFASVENAFFVIGSGELSVVAMRAFTATIAHACLSGGLGFCLGMTRFTDRRRIAGLLVAGGLLAAILLHGLYDLFLFTWPQLKAISLLLVLPGIILCLGLLGRWSQRAASRHHPSERSAAAPVMR
ncbi:MAG: PrsW family intramembrane metalloprotease [Planctomycetota bacterium]